MDLYEFIIYLTATFGAMTILTLSIWVFGVRPQTKRLQEESKKLQLKINQFKNEIGEYGGNSEDLVKGALSGIGIDGMMDQLGIDPNILKNPLVKGLVDKYAPRLLEQFAKGKNVAGKEEIPLL